MQDSDGKRCATLFSPGMRHATQGSLFTSAWRVFQLQICAMTSGECLEELHVACLHPGLCPAMTARKDYYLGDCFLLR